MTGFNEWLLKEGLPAYIKKHGYAPDAPLVIHHLQEHVVKRVPHEYVSENTAERRMIFKAVRECLKKAEYGFINDTQMQTVSNMNEVEYFTRDRRKVNGVLNDARKIAEDRLRFRKTHGTLPRGVPEEDLKAAVMAEVLAEMMKAA